MHYTIERQQPLAPTTSQQVPPFQSPVEASASTRGQSYAQRLYASALGKQPQSQARLQTDGRRISPSGPRELDSDLQISAPGRPSRFHGARPPVVSSLMINASQAHDSIPSPQPVSALDFYHSSVSQLGLLSPVADRITGFAEARRSQSVMSASSNVSVPHSPRSLISQTAPYDSEMQAPNRVPPANSNILPPSPSNPAELHSRSQPSQVPTLAGNVASPDPAQTSSQNVSPHSDNVISPPASSELLPTEFSHSEDHVRHPAQLATISSRPESATQNSHLVPICGESLDLGPEEVPLYSLVDDTPPPPDFDESQSICGGNVPSMYHPEEIVLSPPDAPSPSPPPHDISRAVSSTSADIPPPPPPNPSPDPVPQSLQPISAMGGVPSYSPKKAFVYAPEKLYGSPVEDFVPRLPEEARSYATNEPLLSSDERVASYRQRAFNDSSNDARRLPAPPVVTTHPVGASNTSPKAISTTSPPTPPLTLPAASPPSSPKPSAVNVHDVRSATSLSLRPGRVIQPPPLPPRVIQPPPLPPKVIQPPPLPPRVRAEISSPSSAFIPSSVSSHAEPPMLPAASTPSRSTPSAVNSVDVRPATFLPLHPGSVVRPNSPPPLPPKVRADRSSVSSALIPSSVSRHAGTPSHPDFTISCSPLPFPQHSHTQSIPSTPSTDGRPVEFRPQLSPPISPAWHGEAQVPFQSQVQGIQPQASPPPPQHTRAQNVTARSPQSSRNIGSIAAGIAGGALGLLTGAVFAEALGGNEVVDDLAGNMAGMTFGDPTDGLLDSSTGGGDQFYGNGFDPTPGFQGDQTFTEESFTPSYDIADPSVGYGLDSDQAAGFQEQLSSLSGSYFVSEQVQETQQFDATQTFNTASFPGQPSTLSDSYFVSEQVQETEQFGVTQTFNISQEQQQPNNQNSGTHYLHDAEQILQTAYKIYNATQQSGVAQGSQNSQTTAPFQQPVSANPGTSLHSNLPNSSPVPMTSAGPSLGAHAPVPSQMSFIHPTTTSYPSTTQHIGQSTHLTTSPTVQSSGPAFSQHHPFTSPVSQQINHPLSHHHTSPQGSHTQNPYINHTAYPSSGIATHTMSSQGPIQAQHVLNHGVGSPHGHHTLPGSHAHGQYSMHSATHLPQGNLQQGHAAQHSATYLPQGNLQQGHTAQHPSSANGTQNKAALARQVVKGALIAGGVLAKYSNLNGGNGFFGNGGGS